MDYLDHHDDGVSQLNGIADEWNIKEYELINSNGDAELTNSLSLDKGSDGYQKLLSDGTPLTVNHVRYYIVSTSDNKKLIYGFDYTNEEKQLSTYYSIRVSLSSLTVGNTSAVTVVNTKDGTIEYSDDTNLVGNDAETEGYSISTLEDGFNGVATVHSKESYVSVVKNGDMLLIAAKPYADLVSKNQITIDLILLLVGAVIVLLMLYSQFIQKENNESDNPGKRVHLFGKMYYHPETASKIRVVMIIGIAAVLLMTFYLETLSPLSRQGTLSENRLSSVNKILKENDQTIDEIKQEYSNQYTKLAWHISYLIELDPEMIDHDTLKRIADAENLQSIYVFDGDGNASAMSIDVRRFALSTNPDDQSYVFRKVVNGEQAYYVQEAGYDELGDYIQLIGVQRRDADGMVQIGVEPSRLEERLKANDLSATLNGITIGQNGFLFAADKESKTITSYPNSSYMNKSSSVLGLTDSIYTDDYSGIQSIDGESYFINGFLYNTDYVYTAIPLSTIYSGRLTATVEVTVITSIIIILMSLSLIISSENDEKKEGVSEKENNDKKTDPAFFNRNRLSGDKAWTQSATSRYGDIVGWNEKSAEQKLWALAGAVIAIVAIAVTFYIEVFRYDAMSNNILHYIVNRKWERGFNLFSVTYCVFVMTDIVVITWFIRMIIMSFFRRFGSRSETVGHLLNSFLKYASVIGGIFYCLNAFGLDTNTLLASAGILSVVIGLGAQSLIGDILAGISIVFEGSFRVGDIVTIDGWRGEVVEIGIRTTKVRSSGNDIRIFNNSNIASVINMTKQYSYAMVDVGIDYAESLEHVETVLKNELPIIKKNIPAIVSGPFYKGVTELGDSSVTLRILAQCSEADRIQVTRDLNREVLLVFSKNNINIPFPQVVVNQPIQKTTATKHEKREAESFVEDQKEQSKNIQKDD